MKKTTEFDQLLNMRESALYLHLSYRQLRYYRQLGQGPRGEIKIGKKIRLFKKEDLDDWKQKVLGNSV